MSNDFKNKSTEQLKNSLKTQKTISIFLIVVLIPLFALTIYGLLTNENKATFLALFTVAISCSAMLPLQFASMKKIKEELQSRKK